MPNMDKMRDELLNHDQTQETKGEIPKLKTKKHKKGKKKKERKNNYSIRDVMPKVVDLDSAEKMIRSLDKRLRKHGAPSVIGSIEEMTIIFSCWLDRHSELHPSVRDAAATVTAAAALIQQYEQYDT